MEAARGAMHDYQSDLDAIAQIEAVPRILDVVCRTTGMGFAAVARVTDDRWITCAVKDEIAFGLTPGAELPVHTTICDEIRGSGEGVVIDHVAEDPDFRAHHTPLQYGFQSYISMPIRLPDGEFFGTLCAIDPRPARLRNPETVGMFQLFAEMIGSQLAMRRQVASTSALLTHELKEGELRDQFIAVLGHDLRNPVAAIEAGARLLGKVQMADRERRIVEMLYSTSKRMQGIIENVMDFARGRLGNGFSINKTADGSLHSTLEQVVLEMRAGNLERKFETDLAAVDGVVCDPGRIGQLLSNLLGNAVRHGAPDGPIRTQAKVADGVFELSVANSGEPIPPAIMEAIFQPFVRKKVQPGQDGLGLGLYIASEIARAHGGKINVTSSEAETRFTLRMPA